MFLATISPLALAGFILLVGITVTLLVNRGLVNEALDDAKADARYFQHRAIAAETELASHVTKSSSVAEDLAAADFANEGNPHHDAEPAAVVADDAANAVVPPSEAPATVTTAPTPAEAAPIADETAPPTEPAPAPVA